MGRKKVSQAILGGSDPAVSRLCFTQHLSSETGCNETGATMMEYVLIVCCLMLVAISSVSMVGAETRDTFVNVKAGLAHSNVPTAVTPPQEPE